MHRLIHSLLAGLTFAFLQTTGAWAAGSASPPDFTVLASTDLGRSLIAQKPGVTTIRAALEFALAELTRQFGTAPAVGRAYEDARDHQSGGATFTAKLNGKLIRGLVSCKLNGPAGATIAVIYSRTDATRADWDKLTNPTIPPTVSKTTVSASRNLLGADSTEYVFPDGTGSIRLAAGYNTQAQSAATPVFIRGPDGQTVVINNTFVVSTPDSQAVRQVAHNREMMKRLGGHFPSQSDDMLVASFSDPRQALKDLNPQLSRLSQSRGGPALHLERIIAYEDVDSAVPGGHAGFISVASTRDQNGVTTNYRAVQTLQMSMPGPGTWVLTVTGINGPEASFDQDAPVMAAMLNSLVTNDEIVQQRLEQMNRQTMQQIRDRGEAAAADLKAGHDQFQREQTQRFETFQKQHAEQQAGYDRHNQQWEADELRKQRSAADFIETIKGTRTVYDRQTGGSATANLYYVDGVVDALNQAALDPDRFVQIPLRDEMHPLPVR
jgi:hypothetical protein